MCAPSESVPVLMASGGYGPVSGNSYAAPQVSALAAILLWLKKPPEEGGWTPAQVKSYLLTNPEGTPNMVTASDAMVPTDGTMFYPVINFYLAIMAQLREMASVSFTATSAFSSSDALLSAGQSTL